MPTLSDEGVRLFLKGMSPQLSSKSLRSFVWNLFHSDYDERLGQVVIQSWENSRALAAEFSPEQHFGERLEASVHALLKLMISNDLKQMKKKNVQKHVRFWLDVMKKTFETQDYQTTHLILSAISHPIIRNIDPKMQKWANALIREIRSKLGGPVYEKHVRFWRTIRSDTPLPSLFAFNKFIQVRHWQGKHREVAEALQMIEIFQYLEHEEVTSIYKQTPISKFCLQRMAARIV